MNRHDIVAVTMALLKFMEHRYNFLSMFIKFPVEKAVIRSVIAVTLQ